MCGNGDGEISGRRKNKNLQSHTSQTATCTPSTPLASPSLVQPREGHASDKCQGWRTIQLICSSSNWARGNPVLSSTSAPYLSLKNIYIHTGPCINGGHSLAYQEKPLSRFWKALRFSIQILFYSDFAQQSSQDSRMLGPTTSRRHVDQNRCPAPILQKLQEGNCGLNQYLHSGWADSLSIEWEVKREEVPTGAKTDLTHACQQVARKRQHLSYKWKWTFQWSRLPCGVTDFADDYQTISHLDDTTECKETESNWQLMDWGWRQASR